MRSVLWYGAACNHRACSHCLAAAAQCVTPAAGRRAFLVSRGILAILTNLCRAFDVSVNLLLCLFQSRGLLLTRNISCSAACQHLWRYFVELELESRLPCVIIYYFWYITNIFLPVYRSLHFSPLSWVPSVLNYKL